MRTTDHIIDEWLVVNCQNGDQKAKELLVKRWNYRIVRRIYLTTHDHASVQDLAQDSWITILEKINSLKDPSAFQWWSLRIATTKAIDWIRANQLDRKRDEVRQMAQSDFMEQMDSDKEEVMLKLREAILGLPEQQRLTVQMFYHEGLDILNISRILNLPTGTVKSRLFQARERLKNILNDKKIAS